MVMESPQRRRQRGLGMNSGTGDGESGLVALRRKLRASMNAEARKKMRVNSLSLRSLAFFCGAEGSRTPVQTYSVNAFYMFSFVLVVGVSRTETNLLHP